ncbi:MAG TPA: hypothetical protein VFF43_08435 [Caldimonas sp.]|nr:hypothetical protein [Caldimonas sp.]
MAKTPVVKTSIAAMEIDGLAPTLRAFNTYGKEANAELRDASGKIAGKTAAQAAHVGASLPQQAPLAASSLRVARDRVPALQMGGARKVGHRRAPVGALIYGAEFGGRGSSKTMQFLPHRGRDGYFLFPTIRARGLDDTAIYLEHLDALGARWAAVT